MIFRLFKTQVLLCLIIMSLSLVILEKCLPFKTGILSDFTVVRCGEQNEQGGSCPQQPGMRFKLVGNDKKMLLSFHSKRKSVWIGLMMYTFKMLGRSISTEGNY